MTDPQAVRTDRMRSLAGAMIVCLALLAGCGGAGDGTGDSTEGGSGDGTVDGDEGNGDEGNGDEGNGSLSAPFEIPDLFRLDPDDLANALLTEDYCEGGPPCVEVAFAEEPSDTTAPGEVIRIDPPVGATVERGDTVTIFVAEAAPATGEPSDGSS